MEELSNEKILAAIFVATLMFATVGATLFVSDTPTAEAKSYKSGKKALQTIIIAQISKNLRTNLKIKIMQQQIKTIQHLQTKQIQQQKRRLLFWWSYERSNAGWFSWFIIW